MSSVAYLLQFLVISVNFLQYIKTEDVSNMLLEKYELCPGTLRTDIILFINPKNFNRGQQKVDINYSSPYSVGNNVVVKVSFELESGLSKDSWITVFSLEDKKGFCHSLDAYMGDLAHGAEKQMGMIPKTCPIPPGAYHTKNYIADYRKLKIQTIPFGRVRAVVEILHKQLNKIVSCQIFTLSNEKREA